MLSVERAAVARLRRAQRGVGFLEALVVVVLIVVAVIFLVPRFTGVSPQSIKTAGSAVTGAKDAVCRSNLTAVRQAIGVRRMSGSTPRSLADLSLPAEETHCIVGGEEYVYSAETGEVRCPHPGHESY
jgi:hypothetical protein